MNINILNFYGEDLNEGHGFGLFLICINTSIDIKYKYIYNKSYIIIINHYYY